MLFWDAQVGSDGLACASCHFQAGADNRVKNQINPGMRNASGAVASDNITPIGNVFDFMASYPNTNDPLAAAAGKGPNYTLKKTDFPLTAISGASKHRRRSTSASRPKFGDHLR